MSEVWGVALELGRWLAIGCMTYGVLWLVARPKQEDHVWHDMGIHNAQGEYPHLLSKQTVGDGTTYTYWVPDGVDVSKLRPDRGDGKSGKLYEMVKQAFAGTRHCEIALLSSNRMSIKVYEKKLAIRYEFDPAWLGSGSLLRIPIGQSLRGVEYIHLGDSSAHIGIAGTTGSGKSTAVKVIVTWLIAHEERLNLFLIDLKGGVELGAYERSYKVKGFAKTEGDARAMISALVVEMNGRYTRLADAGVTNIGDYTGKMRRVVLVVDEFADLSGDKAVMEDLVEIARKGRAAGVHMVLSTQRPDAQTIDGRLKANVTTWLCFKVKMPVNSTIILGHGGAETLRGQGHGILDRGDRETEIQGYILDDDTIKRLITPTLVDKPKPEQADTSGVLEW